MKPQSLLIALLVIVCIVGLGWIGLLRSEVNDLQSLLEQRQTERLEQQAAPRLAPPVLPQPEPEEPVVRTKPTAHPSAEDSQKLRDLQELVAGKDRVIERLQAELQEKRRTEAVPQPEPEQQARRGNFTSYMERLKDENPERYEQIQERMRNFATNLEQHALQQSDFVAELDLTKLANDDPEAYAKLQDGLKRMNEIATQMQQAQTNGEEVPRELRREMFSTMRDMQPTLEDVRGAALTDLAIQLGYRPENSSEFVDYVKYIYDMTSVHGFRRATSGR